MFKKIFIILLYILIHPVLFSQDNSEILEISFDQAIELLLMNNDKINSLKLQNLKAIKQFNLDKSELYPEINFNSGSDFNLYTTYNYYINNYSQIYGSIIKNSLDFNILLPSYSYLRSSVGLDFYIDFIGSNPYSEDQNNVNYYNLSPYINFSFTQPFAINNKRLINYAAYQGKLNTYKNKLKITRSIINTESNNIIGDFIKICLELNNLEAENKYLISKLNLTKIKYNEEIKKDKIGEALKYDILDYEIEIIELENKIKDNNNRNKIKTNIFCEMIKSDKTKLKIEEFNLDSLIKNINKIHEDIEIENNTELLKEKLTHEINLNNYYSSLMENTVSFTLALDYRKNPEYNYYDFNNYLNRFFSKNSNYNFTVSFLLTVPITGLTIKANQNKLINFYNREISLKNNIKKQNILRKLENCRRENEELSKLIALLEKNVEIKNQKMNEYLKLYKNNLITLLKYKAVENEKLENEIKLLKLKSNLILNNIEILKISSKPIIKNHTD